jgi:hypothetical protein
MAGDRLCLESIETATPQSIGQLPITDTESIETATPQSTGQLPIADTESIETVLRPLTRIDRSEIRQKQNLLNKNTVRSPCAESRAPP